jgi:CBS domain-containing protein
VLIEHILHTKGADVVTVTADQLVSAAIGVLREHNIGALVVSGAPESDTVVGILSERDVVRELAAQGSTVLNRTVGDLMSTEVTTCEPRATVDQVMRIMTERRIRHIPVVSNGRLTGLVSIGDVVKSRIGELEHETETLHDYLSPGWS